MFLYLEFLEANELRSTGLQIKSTSGLVSYAVLAGARQQRHELCRTNLYTATVRLIIRVQKNSGFFKKPNPVGFFVFWGFIGFFWTSRKKYVK